MNFDDLIFGEFGAVVIAAEDMLAGDIENAGFAEIELLASVWI